MEFIETIEVNHAQEVNKVVVTVIRYYIHENHSPGYNEV